jgi:hypothetical protein
MSAGRAVGDEGVAEAAGAWELSGAGLVRVELSGGALSVVSWA